ncbi:MAG: hypothetical protein L0K65_07970 [Actinomyces sp.]|nr:hypothetical protein [Actinomyces sp.]
MAEIGGTVSGDFEVTTEELRVVTRFVVVHAEDVLQVFEEAVPGDTRPREAIEAAQVFIGGAGRSNLQRVASLDAHRAARDSFSEPACLAARSAGDAASAPYLHPIAQSEQVGHILRAAASVAHIRQLQAGGDPAAAEASLQLSRARATPELIDVLSRYPRPARTRSRVTQLMCDLDQSLREQG